MKLSPAIQELIEALRHLPGVGPKSAQRMTLHLLERDREAAQLLGDALLNALAKVERCQRCRNFTELTICEICGDPKRDDTALCVVETPADVMAIEQTGSYRGLYFVLMGHLSPLDGIGPKQLGLDSLNWSVRFRVDCRSHSCDQPDRRGRSNRALHSGTRTAS